MAADRSAIPATCRPAASSARWASRAVAPVVSTSSQTTTRSRRPASRRSDAGRAEHRPGEVGRAGGGVEPGLVDHAAAGDQQPDRPSRRTPGCAAVGRRAPVRAYVGSWPRARAAPGRDGTGTSTTGRPAGAGRRTPPRAAGRAAAGGARTPALLVREDHRPQRAVVLRRRPGRRQARPGSGVGQAGRRRGRQGAQAGRAERRPGPARSRRSGRRAPGRRTRRALAAIASRPGRRAQRPGVGLWTVPISRRSRSERPWVDAGARWRRRGSGRRARCGDGVQALGRGGRPGQGERLVPGVS